MQRSQRFDIANRVIGEKQIRALAAALSTAGAQAGAAGFRATLQFEVRSTGGTSDKTESIDELLATGSLTELEPTRSISMSLSAYRSTPVFESRRVMVELTHGDYGSNYLSVSSADDPNWTLGTLDQLRRIIESAQPSQDHWLIRYRYPVLAVSAPCVGAVLYFAIFHSYQPASTGLAELLFVNFLMGAMPAVELQNRLLRNWPSIELDLGPEHRKLQKQRRVAVAKTFAMVLLPIALRVGYDIVKASVAPPAPVLARPADTK